MNKRLLAILPLLSFSFILSGSMFVESYGVKKPYAGPQFKIQTEQKEEEVITEDSSDRSKPLLKVRKVTKKSHTTMNAGEALAYMVRTHNNSIISMLNDTRAVDFITDDGMEIAHRQVEGSTALQRSKWYTPMVTTAGLVIGSIGAICLNNSGENRRERSTDSYASAALFGGIVGGIGGLGYAYHTKTKAVAVYNYVIDQYKKRFNKD